MTVTQEGTMVILAFSETDKVALPSNRFKVRLKGNEVYIMEGQIAAYQLAFADYGEASASALFDKLVGFFGTPETVA